MTNQKDQLEKDHDLLITLSADVKSGFKSLIDSVNRLENGTYKRLENHENRIKAIEDNLLQHDLIEMKAKLSDFMRKFNTLTQNIKIYGGLFLVLLVGVSWFAKVIIQDYIGSFFR